MFNNNMEIPSTSPSVWREWIEIRDTIDKIHMGEKSPSVWREWIEMLGRGLEIPKHGSLPPCGGSGLKYHIFRFHLLRQPVSLRVEGVD